MSASQGMDLADLEGIDFLFGFFALLGGASIAVGRLMFKLSSLPLPLL